MDIRRMTAILLVLFGALLVSAWEVTDPLSGASAIVPGWQLAVWVGVASVLVGTVLTLAPRSRHGS